MSKCLHVKYSLFLSDFNETRIFSTDVLKNLKYRFIKIRSLEAKLFHADRRTGGYDEANSRFWQFFEGAKSLKTYLCGNLSYALWFFMLSHSVFYFYLISLLHNIA
jgi:hypothetical protein